MCMTPAMTVLPPSVPRSEPLATSLTTQTARQAIVFLSRTGPMSLAVPSQVAAIAIEVLRTMAIKRAAGVIAAVLVCGLVTAGTLMALQPPAPVLEPSVRQLRRPRSSAEEAKSILANGTFEERIPRPDYLTPGRRGQNSRESNISGIETSPITAGPACTCGKPHALFPRSPSGFRK